MALVALIGCIMRYKIGFEFPFFDQKYLLHGHSHFAFTGWVSHILFTLMLVFISEFDVQTERFNRLVWANLVCAYGMLISFVIQGYGPVSILFSTLSIFISFGFALQYFKALASIQHPSTKWFKAALIFNVLSSLGTFFLAYMMMTKSLQQEAYLGSVYFFLHFQYSGWFFFAIMGLLVSKLSKLQGYKDNDLIFKSFFWACLPAYFLSILWAKLPWYLYILPVFAVILQLSGLYLLLVQIHDLKTIIIKNWPKYVRLFFGLALAALIIKLSLQAGSIFPEISKLAFGFRSIVIAYLHLVLLGITTLFLLGYLLLCGYIPNVKSAQIALILFVIGVFSNELILMVQGIASFGYILVPYLNEMLLVVSVLMLSSVVYLFSTLRKLN
ncbi:MAG: hypothetical protein U0T36_00570 [Saprospiraceae bacterium]